MNYVEKILDHVHHYFNLNPATFSGSIDVIVVKRKDGTYASTPFHVRFGKLQLISSKEKEVSITINDEESSLKMKLGLAGEAYFEVGDGNNSTSSSTNNIPIGSASLGHTPSSSPEIRKSGSLPIPIKLSASASDYLTKSVGSSPLETQDYSPISKSLPEQMESKTWMWGWGTLPEQHEAMLNNHHPSNPPENSMIINIPEQTNTGQVDNIKKDKKWFPSFFGGFFGGPKVNKNQLIHKNIESDSEEDGTTGTEYYDADSASDDDSMKQFDDEIQFHMEPNVQQREDIMKEQHVIEKPEPDVIIEHVVPEKDEEPEKVEISKCGQKIFSNNFDKSKIGQAFDENKLDFDSFERLLEMEPNALMNPEIVFRIKGSYYPWQVAGPMILSMMVFGKDLSPLATQKLMGGPQKSKSKGLQKSEWFSFFKRKDKSLVAPVVPVETAHPNTPVTSTTPRSSSPVKTKPIPSLPSELKIPQSDVDTMKEVITEPTTIFESSVDRSLKPTSAQIEMMNLKEGANKITFSVNSSLRGIQAISSMIYLWDQEDRIVISDIDGTITKSDVFGQILPVVFGQDWSHEGVAELYTNIVTNGYKILYLTARAIGQASLTKGFLTSLTQDYDFNGNSKQIRLPDGPVLMSPDRLLYSLNREVIFRNPETFKVACLQDISSVFEQNPFYAGFGNRISDAISYMNVGISKSRIFIINPFGEISCASGAYSKTYTKLNELVNEMFPPITNMQVNEDKWNDWNYWKEERKIDPNIFDTLIT